MSFAYDESQPVLSGVDLTVAAGERIAIVGPSGAGKSTLVSLVPRLYDPVAGSVLIDGQDVRRFPVRSLREQMSLVLQDALLMSGAIRDNIAFGRPGSASRSPAPCSATRPS